MASDKKMDCVILGLLSHENLSGYDIKKRIDGTLCFFWSGSFGIIYPTLAALEKEGFVKRTADSESIRDKSLYSITASGKNKLALWLTDPKNDDRLHYETLLKIFFSGSKGKDCTLLHIENFEKKSKSALEILKTFEVNLLKAPAESQHTAYLLTVQFGIETYTAYLKWCKKAKILLGEK